MRHAVLQIPCTFFTKKWKMVFFFTQWPDWSLVFWQTFILIEAEKKSGPASSLLCGSCGGAVCNLLKALNHALASATACGPLQSCVKSHPAPMHQSHEQAFLFVKGRNNQAGSWNPISEVYSLSIASCPTLYRPSRPNRCPLYNSL